MANGIGGLNRETQLVPCDCCKNWVPRLELKWQDGVMKCSNCKRLSNQEDWDRELQETNAAVPVLVKWGGKSRRFR